MADNGILYPTADIWVDTPHRAFGLMVSPPYTLHDDFDTIFDQTGVTKQGCYIDRNARVLMGAPTPMVIPTTFGAGKYHWAMDASPGMSTAWHDDVLDPDTGQPCLMMDDANTDVLARVTSSWSPTQNEAYFVKILKGEAPVDATHDAAHCWFYFDLGYDATTAVYYRIEAAMGQPFRLVASFDNQVTWQLLRYTDTIPDSEQYLAANNRRCLITVIPVPHRKTISIYIGNGDGDLSFTDANILYPNYPLAVVSRNGKIRVTFLPAGYPSTWVFKSGRKDLTFRPRTQPQVLIWPDGDEHAATVSTPAIPKWAPGNTAVMLVFGDPDFPQVINYTITATMPQGVSLPLGYSDTTIMLDWAEIFYPALTYNDSFSAPVRMGVESVVERHIFDTNNLNLTRQATLIADNYHGQWSYSSGMRAVSIARGWDGNNEIGFVGWIGETIRYTRSADARKAMFWAFDRSFPLRRRKCGILPPMDAWCPNAAMRFLAQRGGVTEEWLQYIPYCPTGPNPRGCTHALLPMGSGSHPRMKPPANAALWDQMNRIRALYRGILGFDRFGYLRFQAWDPESFDFFGWYTTVPQFNGGIPYLNEIVNTMETTADVRNVRSEITLVGIDPSNWSPIVVHEQNDDIVYNENSPAFLGFVDDWVEVDPIFTNLAFMQLFADLMIQQTSIPTVSTNHGAYLQPGLHLLDLFGVSEPITIGNAIMYASALTHSYRIGGEGSISATTAIEGKAVANLFG